MVERVLGKDEVMGSNPISSSDCVGLDFCVTGNGDAASRSSVNLVVN